MGASPVGQEGSAVDDPQRAGAVVLVEVVAGTLLALVITFFFVEDGERFQRWVLGEIPEDHREFAVRASGRAWWTLAGYLEGSAVLGVLEAVVIGAALL
ncbi:MAG: hypothetical protein M3179_07920 [Actinomycetota bacterium]|nr:hypothetical protein [Actinomycetota bacterium]